MCFQEQHIDSPKPQSGRPESQQIVPELHTGLEKHRRLRALGNCCALEPVLKDHAYLQTALVLSNITLEHNPDTEKVNASQSTRAEGCALQSDNGKDRRLASSSITRETLTSFTFWPDHYKHHLMNTREM
ncbi:unnamed protein product [Leuciscus chuanchicus]